MRSRSQLVVRRGRVDVLGCEPPIALRVCDEAVYIVGSAAGPIGGDDVSLTIEVGEASTTTVRSVAAAIALPGPDRSRSNFRVDAHVGPGATLAWYPEPLVAAARCDHVSDVHVHLDPDATLRWREELILGREGEDPGRCSLRMRVDRGDSPLLRHDVEIERDHSYVSFGALGRARAVGTLVIVDPCVTARPALVERARDHEVAIMSLDRGGSLVTVLAADARVLRATLTRAECALRSARGHP